MTSEVKVSKTNEFLRRRKLRLQQVREQSKDIAKKIRQRAKVEKLRNNLDVDAKKEKEYFDCQEKLVKRLELLYAKSLQNVGTSHKNAVEASQTVEVVKKTDLSKLRGKEAVSELRKRKQVKLDEQKKILDRKLQARELANELSREKSSNVAKSITKVVKKSDNLLKRPDSSFGNINNEEKTHNTESRKINPDVTTADMATQWEFAELPKEWDPNIPTLSLPKDVMAKDTAEYSEKSDKNKRLNLFALSDEMPSSLRGGLSSVIEETVPLKPSLTLVSEYLQNRSLKLREFEPVKRPTDELQSIKQTLLRTRASRADGSISDICHVLDKQVIPVPSWQAHNGFGDYNNPCILPPKFMSHFPSNLHAPPQSYNRLISKQVFKKSSKVMTPIFGIDQVLGDRETSARLTDPERTLMRKKSISIYNHNTRDVVDIPYTKDGFVVQDKKSEDDAYAKALQETAGTNNIEREQLNKRQKEMRNKIAVTRHNVDKEYRDTLAFLNSLPKDTGNIPIKTTYMDDQQQQMEKARHQKKMQLEFKKIERECCKKNCKHNKRNFSSQNNRNVSKSPMNDGQHREYSWMPVPESDGSLAIHTIPMTKKSGNTVKFTEPNTYHEYRSRHKHTPPTKDNDQKYNNIAETLILQNSNESDKDNEASDTSSVENLTLDKEKTNLEVRDADKIIIYKVLEAKNKKKNHKKSETFINTSKGTSSQEVSASVKQNCENMEQRSRILDQNSNPNGVSLENLQEGIYKGISSEGDNMTSMYFSQVCKETEAIDRSRQTEHLHQACCCKSNELKEHNKDLYNEGGDNTTRSIKPVCLNCGKKPNEKSLSVQPSAASSTTSFRTAPNDKISFPINSDSGFLKMVEEGGQESGKFYIGASGFIKNDNYEVIIQLRKKEGETTNNTENKEVHVSASELENPDITKPYDDQNIVDVPDLDSPSMILKEQAHSLPSNAAINVETNKEEDKTKVDLQTLNNVKLTTTESQTNTCEKAVHTSFEDTFAVPIHAPKSDLLPRPATSTYTQTSFNSSTHRPAFMHMSSSTSTAYMSPPELFLPKFLKQDRIMTYDESLGSENTVNHTDRQYVVIEGGEEYECKCKHCACVYKDIKCTKKNVPTTPPNTVRSLNRDRPSNEMKYRKRKCNKCIRHSQSKVCHKSHKNRTNSENTRSSRNVPCDSNAESVQIRNKISAKSINTKVKNNANEINPVVKNYINKLLSLNREGLKAIEIINQDCSVASTPGSSIINLTSNKGVKQTSTNDLRNKISLEQIKNILKEQILTENFNDYGKNIKMVKLKRTENQYDKVSKSISRLPKKKSVHKVKSLNISRQLIKKKFDSRRPTRNSHNTTSTSSSTREEKKIDLNDKNHCKSRSKSSPTPRSFDNSEYKNSTSSDIVEPASNRFKKMGKNLYVQKEHNYNLPKCTSKTKSRDVRDYNLRKSYISSDSEVPSIGLKHFIAPHSPTNISTQTNGSTDVEGNLMQLAENKLQNMEKIADMTEKCTKRLSNLAKVLEEVRKHKSLVYSQISASDSASEAENKLESTETTKLHNKETETSFTSSENKNDKIVLQKDCIKFTPILKDIPKPKSFLASSNDFIPVNDKSTCVSDAPIQALGIKNRGRPPPALSRINLKNGQDFCVTPHELSTVVEVDSPMSFKLKNQCSRLDTKIELQDKCNQITHINDNKQEKIVAYPPANVEVPRIDPDLLQSNVTLSRHQPKILTDSFDDSKKHTMDLKQFNDIMLKPFITLQEYAKQCNIGLDEGSNIEDVMKHAPVNDELSSLHSDGSLPDVIAELLKRKMISEPFRFDSASNVNSTTLSSESTLSILPLSKTRKHKRKSGISQPNKENIGETSETLSISSNPDLENAFQKLGMGWASSTLKKTKERLALSSSSNTSSSSMTQFKIRTFSQEVPTLVTDSTSSLLDVFRGKKLFPDVQAKENSKNVVQQTSLINSMTVKEFLTNELAKKITFSNDISRKEADNEFMSLYETNIPDNMKNTHVGLEDGDENHSHVSANNNRARTSTPVQIYKSTTYNSTTSSSGSNGLFSNADDLSSVKVTSTSIRNHSTSDKDDLTIPNYSLKIRKELSDYSKSD